MTTLAPPTAQRPTPKKLGAQPRHDAHYRETWHRGLDDAVREELISVDYANRTYSLFWQFSDETAKDCWPSQETLAAAWHCSRRTVQRVIDAGRRAGILKTAQLKGRGASGWFSSSNTHRAILRPEWLEKVTESRAAKRDAARRARLEAKATPARRTSSSPDEQTRPTIPDVDPAEYARAAQEALTGDERRERARRAREALLGRPPPE